MTRCRSSRRVLLGACAALVGVGPWTSMPAAQSLPTADPGAAFVVPAGRTGDPAPVCGLGAAFHAGRREALRDSLEKGLVVLRGLPDTRDYLQFRQDKLFWYLTGVESPEATLILEAESDLEILFLPDHDPVGEMIEGEKWDTSDDWISEVTGFDTVLPNSQLPVILGKLLADREVLFTSLKPAAGLAGVYDRAIPFDRARESDVFDGRVSREKRFAERLHELYGVEVRDIAPITAEIRRVKAPEEIAALARAGESGARAMEEAIRSTRPGLGEWDLQAVMDFVQRRNGADGPAYDAIVGSGPNSTTLHYWGSRRRLQPDDALCVDFGPEVDHYVTDITRSWPADGTFSERHAELYDAVLAAQKAGIAAVKPGATIPYIEQICFEELKQRGLNHLVLHGNCHYVGMEVHDVGNYFAPLEPGVCFVIEPGLYDPVAKIGVRIEDTLMVTEDGCDVLTRSCPKERDEIEALVAAPGLLDLLDAGAR